LVRSQPPYKKSPVEAGQEEVVTSRHLPEFTARFNSPTGGYAQVKNAVEDMVIKRLMLREARTPPLIARSGQGKRLAAGHHFQVGITAVNATVLESGRSPGHVATIAFNKLAGLNLVIAAYRGTPPASPTWRPVTCNL
jgi:hypothetical protein